MGILPKNVCHGARLPRLFANNGMTSLGCHPVLPFGLYTAILRLQIFDLALFTQIGVKPASVGRYRE